MSIYLELPKLNKQFPYRMLCDDGMAIVYPHWHKEVEIIYAKKGKINIGLNNQIIELIEGEIVYFASGEPHYFLASPDSERYVYQFDLRLFNELFLRINEEPLTEFLKGGERLSSNWPMELKQIVKNLLLELYQLEVKCPEGKNYLAVGCLYRLIGKLYEQLPRNNSYLYTKSNTDIQKQETLERLNKIFDYVENHYQEDITIENIAKFIGYNPHYFTRFFKKNIGQTFIQFLTEYRLNQAKFILVNENISMTEVSEKSGFSSVKTFHHVFKKSVGQSPLQYRKNKNKQLSVLING